MSEKMSKPSPEVLDSTDQQIPFRLDEIFDENGDLMPEWEKLALEAEREHRNTIRDRFPEGRPPTYDGTMTQYYEDNLEWLNRTGMHAVGDKFIREEMDQMLAAEGLSIDIIKNDERNYARNQERYREINKAANDKWQKILSIAAERQKAARKRELEITQGKLEK